MGYQQSFIKFKNNEVLKQELKVYSDGSKKDQAGVYGVVEVIKEIEPFKIGDRAMVVGGERYPQRNKENLEEELGIKNVEQIVFIDNELYCTLSNENLGEFLDEHFKSLSEEEIL